MRPIERILLSWLSSKKPGKSSSYCDLIGRNLLYATASFSVTFISQSEIRAAATTSSRFMFSAAMIKRFLGFVPPFDSKRQTDFVLQSGEICFCLNPTQNNRFCS